MMCGECNWDLNEKKLNEKHLFTAEEKLAWWGEGEWIKEPDEVEFEHEGIKCRIIRSAKEENSEILPMFGGYFCGYVCVPKDHPFYQKHYDEIDIDVHGGLTFGEGDPDYWIGFDCAHARDILPSTKNYFKIYGCDLMENFLKNYGCDQIISETFKPTYKNIAFCIGECKSMAEQLNKAK